MISSPKQCPQVPWPVWRQPAQRMLHDMLGELEGLPVTGGEVSVRLSEQGIENGRWLAGFSPLGVSARRLHGLPQRLGMQSEDAQWFISNWERARQIYLALAQTREQVVAKVYLEYPLPAPEQKALPSNQRQVALQIESRKWPCEPDSLDADASSRQTEYWRLSGVDGPVIAQLLSGSSVSPVGQAYLAIAGCLRLAMDRAPLWRESRLLLVRDSGVQRHGAGLRFYGSGLKAIDVVHLIEPVCTAWGLDLNSMPDLLRSWNTQDLGWLHAGTDSEGQPYLIVYGALSDAQVFSVLGTPLNSLSPNPVAMECAL